MKANRRSLMNPSRSSAVILGLVVSALGATGCMEFSDPPEVELATNVVDWREEIIYQVLVDRFADGDWGNNYSIFPSAPGKWHGGDWKGLEDRLDYLDELGVTTLWISPVVKNVYTDAGFDAYHGYWAQDLTQPAPQFGDLEALQSLVKAAHARNMKVILDIVTNHMGQLFFYDINGNGQADDPLNQSVPGTPDVFKENEYDPTYDVRGVQAETSLGESGLAPIIFAHDPASNHMPPLPEILQNPLAYNRKGRTYNFDDPDQLLRGDFPGGLKDVNTELCPIRDAMVDAYTRWIELTDIDGFRIDTVKHVENGFWRHFTQKVRQRLAAKGKTNFFMFGEAFDGRDPLVGSFTKNGNDAPPPAEELAKDNTCVTDGVPLTPDMLDSVFYFPQQFQVVRDVFRYRGPTSNIQKLWADRAVNYGATPAAGGAVNAAGQGISPQKLLVNFLDNHDVPRFLFTGAGMYPEDPIFGAPLPFETRQKMLHNALLFLFTEEGIPCVYYGTEQDFQGGNDPGNREDLWISGYDTNAPTFRWIRRLSDIRRKYPALSKGDLQILWASDRTGPNDPDANVFAFERTGGDAGDSYAIVVINANIEKDGSPAFGGQAMQVGAAPGTVLVDVLDDGGQTHTVGPDGRLSITLPPSSGAVLVPESQR
ncbi:alpha-amylase family glycosyl hydrolase [Polyangium spumosum]|uniref:alpha-amylase n=1 Tax=Polyangium spumosum TaxID=889282 RepID=A0A6N7Q264_9BACT|nr:alpha-amylase family glycosyl hydrolase [Polyangium spumosum]MRG96705.1 alpha-amylase [Polyangium spumosum]